MHEGVDGLLRDKTRPPGKPRLPDEAVQRVLDLTLSEPPGDATHWTGRMMAKASEVSFVRCSASGMRMGLRRIASAPSSSRVTRCFPSG